MTDQKNVSEMSRIISILNNKQEDVSNTSNMLNTHVEKSDKDIMKDILNKFHNAQNNPNNLEQNLTKITDSLIKESENDKELREAMYSERTQAGIKIGDYYIKEHKDRGFKLFNIYNENSLNPVAINLHLYEAAYGIAKYLFEGKAINSYEIKSIFLLEEEYSSILNNAIWHKRQLSSQNLSKIKRNIIEDRYENDKRKVFSLKERINKLIKD